MLAKLCVHMETTTVPHVVEVLAGAFQGGAGFSGSDGPPRFVGGEVARQLGSTASEWLCRCSQPGAQMQALPEAQCKPVCLA